MSVPEASVHSRLEAVGFPRDRYVIHRGFIEDLIRDKQDFPAAVSFAYADFDFYEPTSLVLRFLDGVMPSGGMVIVDDYGFFSSGVKTAVDEFLDEVNSVERVYDCTIPDTAYGHFALLKKR